MRRLDSNQLIQSEVSALTTDKFVSRGTAGAALVLPTKNAAPSPPGNLETLLCLRMTKASEGPENKTPPEQSAREGFENVEHFRTGSTHSASARKRAHIDAAASPRLTRVR
jgi:hypothetical protein